MRKLNTKVITLVVSIALLLCVSVGGTLAYLVMKTSSLENTFAPASVTTTVEETFENNKKSNVKIKNTGDTTAYIRAAVVVTWQDAAGNVYGQRPVKGTNYTSWTLGTDWVEGSDGFYYYTKPVAAGETTATALINSISPIGNLPATGYFLCVEILGSGLQAEPTYVVESEWTNEKAVITVGNDGTMSVKPAPGVG